MSEILFARLDEMTAAVANLQAQISAIVPIDNANIIALSNLNATGGLLTQTAAATFTKRTMLGTAAQITVTNGDGVAGAPTISLPTAITLTGITLTGGAFVGPALGTPISGVATNLTGTAAGLTAGNVTTNANLTGVITSVGNATSIASQTGTGSKFVVDTSPTLVTPNIGVATATSVNKLTLTAPATGSTLTILNGKTLTVNNSLILAGTDATTMTFPGASDTVATIAATQTLTNKTIAGGSNTLSGIALASLASQAAFTIVANNSSSAGIPTAMDITALTSKATPGSTDIVLIQDVSASNAFKRTTVSALAGAGAVSSIDTLTGAFTTSNGLASTANVLQLTAARRTLPTKQIFLSGTGTYTTPANVLYIRGRMIGAGGGGAGSGTTTTGGSGGTGGATTFNAGAITAPGGIGGVNGTGGSGGAAGTGGTFSVAGGQGGSSDNQLTFGPSAGGGDGFFGGGAGAAFATSAGSAGSTNTGGGGGGGGNNSSGTVVSGGGGGSGAYTEFFIGTPGATFTYAVGAAGTAGTAGTSGLVGGAGGSGILIIDEYYGS